MKKRNNSTRDEFTKWLEEGNKEQQQTNVTPEEATATAGAKAESTKKTKVICIIAILLLAVGIVVSVILYKHHKEKELVYLQVAEQWDDIYNNDESKLCYAVFFYDGNANLITDEKLPNVVLTKTPIPRKPEWYNQGLADCLNGNINEEALFAAKLYSVRKTCLFKKECLALGIGMFEGRIEMTDEQYQNALNSFCWHLT